MPDSPDLPRPGAAVRFVFLVGFMGSGKTSVGQALAHYLGWPFLDLDDQIERRAGRKVAEIFAADGESEFRRIENLALNEVLAIPSSPMVVALGGGAFIEARNAELLRQSGVVTVFLDAPPETLWQRCNQNPQERPLRRTFESFAELHRQRRPHYLRATSHIDTLSKTADDVAKELATRLQAGNLPDEENLR